MEVLRPAVSCRNRCVHLSSTHTPCPRHSPEVIIFSNDDDKEVDDDANCNGTGERVTEGLFSVDVTGWVFFVGPSVDCVPSFVHRSFGGDNANADDEKFQLSHSHDNSIESIKSSSPSVTVNEPVKSGCDGLAGERRNVYGDSSSTPDEL